MLMQSLHLAESNLQCSPALINVSLFLYQPLLEAVLWQISCSLILCMCRTTLSQRLWGELPHRLLSPFPPNTLPLPALLPPLLSHRVETSYFNCTKLWFLHCQFNGAAVLCLDSSSLHCNQETVPWQRARTIMEIHLISFSSLWWIAVLCSCCQCLRRLASEILSSFRIIYGGKSSYSIIIRRSTFDF